MPNTEVLLPLGWTVILVSIAAMVIPVMRGRADAVTFWNLFLLGGITFIGIGCLEVVYGTFEWKQLQWFTPTRKDVQVFVIGTIVFYAAVFGTYYGLASPVHKFTGYFFNKWPPDSLSLTILLTAFALAVTVAALVLQRIVFFGPLFTNLSQKVIIFAVVFTFCHWYQNKRQLPMLGLFLGVFFYCALFAMVTFVGRRLLMSVAVAPVICMYWLKWRYASPKRILIGMAAAGFVLFAAASFYGAIRHARSIHGVDTARTFSGVVEVIKDTRPDDVVNYLETNSLHFFSQYTVHYALLTIQMVDRHELPVEPLNSIKFLISYPIPRAFWPGKPTAMGLRIVTDYLRLGVPTNWGLCVVAHGYQEGGFIVIALYGFLIVIVIRLMDDAMRRFPDNRFLMATLAAGAPHVLAWPRGDTTTMSAEILEAFAFVWIAALASRFVFGTERKPPLPLAN